MGSMYDQGHVWVGQAAIIMRDGKFLMMKRAGKHGAGTWSVPGGWQEVGETFEQAVTREVLEEVGCEIGNLRFGAVTNNYFPDEGVHSISIFSIADWVSGEPQNLEPEKCEELRWVDFDSLPSPLFTPWQELLKSEFMEHLKEELERSKS
ncbi:hypothetical protein BGO17_03110 [Candidatus Saccharibacteria bacterium 49-20]|mgnify:CR=1 FL=1|nr:MAG: hypothetical protein BGO17_03110 [Candidatus Saccharibacteria bacterium 49-20]